MVHLRVINFCRLRNKEKLTLISDLAIIFTESIKDFSNCSNRNGNSTMTKASSSGLSTNFWLHADNRIDAVKCKKLNML